jgi:predicted PurR-regulated permease PerM
MITCLLIILILFTWYFTDIILLFLISAALAFILTPLVGYLQKVMKREDRILATVIVFVCAFAVFVALLALLVPMLYNQAMSAIKNISVYIEEITRIIEKFANYLLSIGMPQGIVDMIYDLMENSETLLVQIATSVGTFLLETSLKVVDWIIFFVVTFYLMLDGRRIYKSFENIFPSNGRIRINRIAKGLNELVWSYLRQRIIISLCMFIVLLIGFLCFGLKYALLLAFLAFCLDFIPYFGSIIAGAIATFSALIDGGWSLAFWVLVFIIAVQQIEGNIISPSLQAKSVDVHPLAVIFSLLACSKLWGIFGMFISVPVVGLVKILFVEIRDLYRSVDRPGGFGSASDEPLVIYKPLNKKEYPRIKAFRDKLLKRQKRSKIKQTANENSGNPAE